jgi:KDO2-lipid IV(A) lauroyltransferase
VGTRLGLWLLQTLAKLPLPWFRALGALLGHLLFYVVPSRRHVMLTNLRLCFPEWSEDKRLAVARESFVYFAQAWLDRGWLWHASEACLRERLTLSGNVDCLLKRKPTVLFVPHFVGLDACSVAVILKYQVPMAAIATPQSNKVVDQWVRDGRMRFGCATVLQREDGIKPIIASMRRGDYLHLSPDMSFGLSESIFVPFYGQVAATVPSLSRFAKLGRARVVPMTSRLTPTGYDIVLHPEWENFPTEDAEADTLLMNQRLESLINDMPAQYFWVHKRFKTRPPGVPEVY